MKKFLRPCGRISDQFIIASFLTLLIATLGSVPMLIVEHFIPAEKFFSFATDNADAAAFMMMYFDFIGIWLFVFLFVLLFKKNRPMMDAVKANKSGNSLRGALIGLLLGFGTNGLCILISCILGDISLEFYGFEPLPFIVFFICVFIQSAAEELVERLYLYQKLRRRYKSPLVAIIVNALVFLSMHLFNPGVTFLGLLQIFVIGVVFSMFVYYYNGLWIVMMFHTGWNFTQSILFGLPNSGNVSAYSLFRLDAASATNGPFYNVNFGVEGSLGACIILIAVGVAVYLMNKDKPEYTDVWQDMDKKETA